MTFFRCFSYIFLLVSSPALAESVYEVTADRPFEPSKETTTLSQEEMETYQETFVKDALPYTPSIQLNSSGTVGRQVDFSMRGARSAQNLVFVDGIYVNNPASGGGVDLSNFLNADLEKIQVLPGPHTLIYGPGALGGVIQLIPKRGTGKPSLKATGEGGSFKTRYGAVTGQGEEGPVQFSATAAGFGRGPDTFTNPLHGNRQNDRYRNGTLSSRMGYTVNDNWELEALVRYIDAKVQFDQLESGLPVQARNFSDTKTLLSSLENKWGGENADHSLKVSYPRFERKTTTPLSHNTSLGEHPLLAYLSEIKVDRKNTLTPGFDLGQERAQETRTYTRSHGGIFLIETYQLFDSTAFKGGLRVDQYEHLRGQLTLNVGAEQRVTPITNLRIAYGTNFKPPTLSDLFQKDMWQVPNPGLKPEKSQSFEAGIDQNLFEKTVKTSLTGFVTRIHKITLSTPLPSGQWQRYNGGHRITQGLEASLTLRPSKALEMKVALTVNRARDYPGGKVSPLIPSFKGAGELHWQTTRDLSLFIQGYGVTSRKDSVSNKTLTPYGVVHVGGSYQIIPHLAFFGRIENLTNKRYEEVFGYGTRGRAFYMGLEVMT